MEQEISKLVFKKVVKIFSSWAQNSYFPNISDFLTFYLYFGMRTIFLHREVWLEALKLCLCVVILEAASHHTQTHITLNATSLKHFTSHPWPNTHHSCVADVVGQCLLLLTSSFWLAREQLVVCLMALVHSVLVQHVPTYFSQGWMENPYVKFS